MGVVIYHLTTPHHPKYYMTKCNKFAIICHIIGGTIGINCFYFGAVFNSKLVCFIGCMGGLTLHLPSVVWQYRQTHGQREISFAAYVHISLILLVKYIDFIIYDGTYLTVVSAGMTLCVFSLVRFWALTLDYGHVESSYDRNLLFAYGANSAIIGGALDYPTIIIAINVWNVWFRVLEPYPRSLLRVERGYSDVIPEIFE